MDSFYSKQELMNLGFKSMGKNIYISRKASIYGAENMELGDNVRIDDFAILSGKISLGNFIHIAAYSALYGGQEGIKIFDFGNISSRVTIYAICDDFSGKSMTNPMIPEQYKDLIQGEVILERHVLIGANTVVLPGITIKEGSSFGAFSLVKQDTEPWSINVGVPCKRVSERSQVLLEKEKEFLSE